MSETETRRKFREVMNECAAYSKQFPKSQRLRAYRECIESKLKGLQ